MSNLFPCDLVLDERVIKYWKWGVPCPHNFPSSEHAYQSLKPYENIADALFILGLPCSDANCEMCKGNLGALSSNDAAKFGQGRFVVSEQQGKWLVHHNSVAYNKQKPMMSKQGIEWLQNNCIDLMMDILRCKFSKDNEMGKKLLEFADRVDDILFTEHTANDKIWADAMDGTGMNFLGKLLTIRLRELIDSSTIKLDYEYLKKPNAQCVKY